MKKLFFILAILMLSAKTFASGGACPSGANYLNPATNILVTLSSLGVTSCYYISAQAGASDSNSGVSESFPWLHSPGMSTCSSVCAGVTPSSGTGFIFRGGDTWHEAASTSPAMGGSFNWSWNGTSSNPIYVGVDPAWYSGGSWSRPKITGDNPLTPNPGVTEDYVSSCAYNNGNLVSLGGTSYVIFDNFEVLGLCQVAVLPLSYGNNAMVFGDAPSPDWYEHLYIHGWTHTDFASCSGGAPACVQIAPLLVRTEAETLYTVIDGSDSDPGGVQVMPPGSGCYVVAYSIFRYVQQAICNNAHVVHDNIFEHWYATVHPNLFENIGESSSTNAFYNNIFRHICTDASPCPIGGLVGIWPEPNVGYTSYWFNNLYYDQSPSYGIQYFNIGTNANRGGVQGTLKIFNNTFENTQNGQIFGCTPDGTAFPFTVANNHMITDDSSWYSATCPSQLTQVTNLLQTHATANGQGYTSSETYAYSPINGTVATVNSGTNETSSMCAALVSAASSDPTLSDAALLCGKDTKYACSYNVSNHTVVCPARTPQTRPSTGPWNVGSYQFSTSGSAPVITSSTTATCPIGLACNYQITATNSPTSYGATLPGCLSINTSTGLITGTCSSLATYSIPLGATNISGTGTAILNLNVGYLVQQSPGIMCSSVSTCTAPFSNNVQLHDLIVVPFAFPSGPSVTSVSDAQGDTFSQVGSSLISSDGVQAQVFMAKSVAAGSGSVTVNLSAAPTFIVQQGPTEYTGLSVATPIDGQSGATGGPTAVSSGNFTTSNTNDEIYGYGREVTGGMSVGAGFTVLSNYNGHLVEQKLGTTAGSYAATGTTSSNWSMQGIGFTAISSAPVVSLSPSLLSFGSQVVSTTSGSQSITLTNTGGTTLTISSITITGTNSGDFAQTNTCGSSVGAGSNCSISVTFTPLSTGARLASVSITDSAAGSPHAAPLSGTGISSSPAAPSGLAIIGIF